MNTLKQYRYTNRFCSLISFAVTIGIQLYYLLPLQNQLIGDDSIYHYLRVDAVAERLRSGEFLSEVSPVFLRVPDMPTLPILPQCYIFRHCFVYWDVALDYP